LTMEEIHTATRIIDAADKMALETLARAVNTRRDTLERLARLTFKAGDRVCFVGRFGAIVSGVVVPTRGHTSKTVNVQADTDHGGRLWRVSAGLLRHDTGPEAGRGLVLEVAGLTEAEAADLETRADLDAERASDPTAARRAGLTRAGMEKAYKDHGGAGPFSPGLADHEADGRAEAEAS
jgi:hypothetical protein